MPSYQAGHFLYEKSATWCSANKIHLANQSTKATMAIITAIVTCPKHRKIKEKTANTLIQDFLDIGFSDLIGGCKGLIHPGNGESDESRC